MLKWTKLVTIFSGSHIFSSKMFPDYFLNFFGSGSAAGPAKFSINFVKSASFFCIIILEHQIFFLTFEFLQYVINFFRKYTLGVEIQQILLCI